MASERDIADCLRLSLVYDLVSVSDIVAWADRVILTKEELSSSIINLSLSLKADKNKVIQLLKDIAWESEEPENSAAVIEILLAIIKKRLSQDAITYEQIVTTTDMFAQNLSDVPEKYRYFYHIHDDYLLSASSVVDRFKFIEEKIDLFIKDYELPESLSLD